MIFICMEKKQGAHSLEVILCTNIGMGKPLEGACEKLEGFLGEPEDMIL